jgi:subtilisin family serine protease
MQRSQQLPVFDSLPDVCCCRFRLPGWSAAELPAQALAQIGDLGARLLDEILIQGALGERLPDADLFREVSVEASGEWPREVDPRQQPPAPPAPGQDMPTDEGSSIPAIQAFESGAADQAGSLLHGWYRLSAPEPDLQAGAARIQAAVLGVNRSLTQVNRMLRRHTRELAQQWPGMEALELIALTPCWLSAAGQEGHIGAGPGVPPEPRPDLPSDWRPSYAFEGPAAGLADASGEGVVVAILDSRPERDEVLAAAQAFQPPHAFLMELLERVRFGGFDLGDPGMAAVEHLVASWEAGDPDGLAQGYAMPDHGIFVSGLVLGAAPDADIHLLRVLNEQGVGDLQSLCALLGQTRARTNAAGKRLIVNLSLVSSIPTEADLEREYRPLRSVAKRQAAGSEDAGSVPPMRAFLGGPLMDAVAALVRDGALVVASAGNDAKPGALRPEPRMPARDDRVLAVGAAGRGGQAAGFSNAADALVMGNGVVAFGGDARWLASGARVDPQDAPVGLFSRPTVPITGAAVPTGWVSWAGTSFAAPLVTALAARIWSSQPTLTAPEVLAAVRGMAGAADVAGLLAPMVPVVQEI